MNKSEFIANLASEVGGTKKMPKIILMASLN